MLKNISHARLAVLFFLALIRSSWQLEVSHVKWQWMDGSGTGDAEDRTEQFLDQLEPMAPMSERGKPCNLDQNCDPDWFCHEHYKYCQRRRYVGERCRRTGNCMRGIICMWGICRRPEKPGHLMSRCKMHNDCNEGLCCAREKGESICKKYLTEGENCLVFRGSLNYSKNHKCACGFGLVCTMVGDREDQKKCRKMNP